MKEDLLWFFDGGYPNEHQKITSKPRKLCKYRIVRAQ